MQIIILYRYEREDGGITISPDKPQTGEYTVKYRLIADEGMTLTDGSVMMASVDVDSEEGWSEIEAPEYPEDADLERRVDNLEEAVELLLSGQTEVSGDD